MVDTNDDTTPDPEASVDEKDQPLFEWDDANIEHIARHHIERSEAEDVLFDPERFVYPGHRIRAERRIVCVGRTSGGRLPAVVYTNRDGRIRIVTARLPNRAEVRRYR